MRCIPSVKNAFATRWNAGGVRRAARASSMISQTSRSLSQPLNRPVQEQPEPRREENAQMAQKAIPLKKVPSQTRRTSQTLRSEALAPYLFLLPFVVLFILFFIVPIIYAIYQSLYRSERNGLGLGAATVSFNGLGNYVDVVHDPNFYRSVGLVLLYGIVQVPVMLILALVLALLLDSA